MQYVINEASSLKIWAFCCDKGTQGAEQMLCVEHSWNRSWGTLTDSEECNHLCPNRACPDGSGDLAT
jgi:hypothetical protein